MVQIQASRPVEMYTEPERGFEYASQLPFRRPDLNNPPTSVGGIQELGPAGM
jgi:hypothetical protein